jgi:rhodanese-related sulfurtransferase
MSDSLRISVDEIRQRMNEGQQFTFVDVRNPQAWSESDEKLPGAIRVPLDGVDDNLPSIPKDKPIVTYCT